MLLTPQRYFEATIFRFRDCDHFSLSLMAIVFLYIWCKPKPTMCLCIFLFEKWNLSDLSKMYSWIFWYSKGFQKEYQNPNPLNSSWLNVAFFFFPLLAAELSITLLSRHQFQSSSDVHFPPQWHKPLQLLFLHASRQRDRQYNGWVIEMVILMLTSKVRV